MAFRRQITLAVIQPERSPLGSEFGWSLPDSQRPLALSELTRLLSQAGIRWVKYPLWCDEEQREAHLDKITRLSDALLGQEIELVGLLARPPEALRTRLEAPAAVSAAEVFTAGSKVWYPSVEAVLARLATQVHYWQLGDDLDASFVGYPRLTEQMTEVKRALDRIGQNVSIGFGWNWISPLPAASGSTPPWRFLSLSADPPLTAGEMAVALDATRGSSAARWVVVQPLPGDQYTLESRVIDLVQRMVAAKVHGADAVFVANPFGGREGLLAADGTPGELLLPWRTTALRLGGAKYLGRIDLPQGSPNEIFAGDGPPVMVVWSDAPAREIVELGPGVRQLDLWGRWTTPSRQRNGQVIEVDRLPKFLVGLDPALIGWQQSLRLVRQQLPNLLGSRQPNELCVENPLDRGTSGRIVIAAPTGWKIEPAEVRFRLARGESLRQPLEITLPGDATCGKYRFQAEIEPYGDPPLRLLVYRPIAVGIGDVTLEIALRKDAQGGLVVEQRFHNHLESPAHFRCLLYAPGRRREKTEVHLIGPGSDLQSYHLPQAARALGPDALAARRRDRWPSRDELSHPGDRVACPDPAEQAGGTDQAAAAGAADQRTGRRCQRILAMPVGREGAFAQRHGIDGAPADAQVPRDFPLRQTTAEDEPLDFVDDPGRNHGLPHSNYRRDSGSRRLCFSITPYPVRRYVMLKHNLRESARTRITLRNAREWMLAKKGHNFNTNFRHNLSTCSGNFPIYIH